MGIEGGQYDVSAGADDDRSASPAECRRVKKLPPVTETDYNVKFSRSLSLTPCYRHVLTIEWTPLCTKSRVVFQ